MTFAGCERSPSSRQQDREPFDSTACAPLGDTHAVLQCTTYYREGHIRRLYTHRNDTLVGEEKAFDETGILRTYSYSNVVGSLLYRRSYDAQGGMSEEYGYVMVQQIIDPPEAQVGDTITVQVYIINPPGVSQHIVGIGKGLERYPLFHEEKESGVFTEWFSLAKPGAFRIAYEALVRDSVNGTSKVENNSFVIRFTPVSEDVAGSDL